MGWVGHRYILWTRHISEPSVGRCTLEKQEAVGEGTECGSRYRHQCSQSVEARPHTHTSDLTATDISYRSSHGWDNLCAKCERMQTAGGGGKRSLSECLLHILDNSAEISDKGHLGTRAVSLTPETCKLSEVTVSFFPLQWLIAYTKTLFSCQLPFAFCEGEGKEHNLFPPWVTPGT